MRNNNAPSYQFAEYAEAFQTKPGRNHDVPGYRWVGKKHPPANLEKGLPPKKSIPPSPSGLERFCHLLVFAGICCFSLAYLVWLFQSASVGMEDFQMMAHPTPISLGKVAYLLN